MDTNVIKNTVAFVKDQLTDAETGHDWWHIERVWENAKHIGATENVDMYVVELGALLHDIADAKFHDGDEEKGPKVARKFLESQHVPEDIIAHVENIVRHISFKGNIEGQKWMSPELAVVQDADRLDALGAIGIARTFTYGGFENRTIYDPSQPPHENMTSEEYKNNREHTINHFYHKLLLLKGLMNTKTGKRVAEDRHAFMEKFLEQFYAEWEGKK